MRVVVSGVVMVWLAACSDDGAGGGGGSETGSSGDVASTSASSDADASSSAGTSTSGSTSSAEASSGGSEGTAGGEDVCTRWNADRADLTEGAWSGSVATCDPGDVATPGRENALRVTNLYRWLADLPPIETSAQNDALAQACALMMHANEMLSHGPPMSWTCWTQQGADGAGMSNISGTPGVFAVDLYMVDPGNPTTLGHRRWLLSNSIGPTGIGSTDTYSCMVTLGGTNMVGEPWMAWPPPGAFPLQAGRIEWTNIDETGWSLQSDTIDFAGAQVQITEGGEDRPVAITQLAGGYGSAFAISMIPQGWVMEAGASYHVSVTGISEPIEYDVDVVDCG
jgi:hypothetical protein